MKTIEQAINSLIDQTLSKNKFEILVIDNASTDHTKEIVSSLQTTNSNLRYIYEDRLGLSNARNRGISEAKAELVAFLDDDARACPEWLALYLEAFESIEPGISAAGGKINLEYEVTPPRWLSNSTMKRCLSYIDYSNEARLLDFAKLEYPFGANMVFRKKKLTEYGGFDPNLGRIGSCLLSNEEKALFAKLHQEKESVYYVPNASIVHLVPKSRLTMKFFVTRQYWQGRADFLWLANNIKANTDNRVNVLKIITTIKNPIQLLGAFFYKTGFLVQYIQMLLKKAVKGIAIAKAWVKSLFNQRSKYECPLCNKKIDEFLPYGYVPRPNAQCPICGSLERHRLTWLFLKEKTNLFTAKLRMMHVAPESQLGGRFKALTNIDYLSVDLESSRAMVNMDITDLKYPDNSFDVIYASHVFEHIPDDKKAMRELFRVLKPGGWAILQVPIRSQITEEDPSIIDPAARKEIYGHPDHVRNYGLDYKDRLTEAGFNLKIEDFAKSLGEQKIKRYGLVISDQIYFCSKPQVK